MREIKFRVFRNNVMQSLTDVNTFWNNGKLEIVEGELMQYTGLKDKKGKGKEVYQGDLFEVVYSNVPNGFSAMNFKKEVNINIGEVVFKFGAFKIKTFHPDYKEDVYIGLHTFLKNDEKVIIGNIFEDKNLLES